MNDKLSIASHKTNNLTISFDDGYSMIFLVPEGEKLTDVKALSMIETAIMEIKNYPKKKSGFGYDQ